MLCISLEILIVVSVNIVEEHIGLIKMGKFINTGVIRIIQHIPSYFVKVINGI